MFEVTRILLYVALFAHICDAQIDIDIEADPGEISDEDTGINFDCTYNFDAGSLETVLWRFFSPDESLVYIYNKDPTDQTGPGEDYINRLLIGNVSDTGHSITLMNASWCNDIGKYTCQIFLNAGNQEAEVAISAHKKKAEPYSDDWSLDDDGTYVVEKDATFKCNMTMNKGFNLTLEGGEEMDEKKATEEGNCTYKAEAKINPEITGPSTISCTVADNEDTETETVNVKLKTDETSSVPTETSTADETSSVPTETSTATEESTISTDAPTATPRPPKRFSGGEIAGIVIGCIAGVAVIVGVAVFIKMKML